ncbi:hypothetical protein MMC32_001611 [Xylographa parallela]|nr:hypothetical protein [Xylographa parallela]
MASEPLSHFPSSQHIDHHFRSLPADLPSGRRRGTPRPEVQPAWYSHITPTQRAILLDQISPAVHPRTRSPSIRSSSRRRASRNHKLLLYTLLTALELLLLALPITIVFLVQATVANRTFIPPLVAFFILAFCACLVAAGVGFLVTRRQRSQLKRKRKLEREVQRWRTLARERGREVEVLRAVSERLRSSSRGRRQRDESMSRAGSSSEPTGFGRGEEEGRSVSRGRTGRGPVMRDLDVEDSIAELDGLEICVTRAVPEAETTKGSVGRARQAAFARMRGEVPEKPLPPTPAIPQPSARPPSPHYPAIPQLSALPTPSHYSPAIPQPSALPPPPHVPVHPPRRASLGWLPRWNAVKASHTQPQSPKAAHHRHESHELVSLRPTQPQPQSPKAAHHRQPSHELEGRSSPAHWSNSQTLISSPLQTLQGRLLEPVLLPPPELVLDDLDSPGVQMTVLDRYVVPEQYRQALERQQELQKRWTQPRRQDLERDASGDNSMVGEVNNQPESEQGWNRVLDAAFDAQSSSAGDEEDGAVEVGVTEIIRGGNGERGEAQSDENFKESHALEEDALSLTESLRRKKRAESLKKVASWEDGTRVAPVEVEENAVALDSGVEDSVRRTAMPQEGEPSWRAGLGIGRPLNSTRDEIWEINERRRNFAMFVETKKLQSKTSSGSERGRVAGLGVSGMQKTV